MTIFDGKRTNLQKTPTHFYATTLCFRYIKILFFYIQKVGQGHGVNFSQLYHSMSKSTKDSHTFLH